MRAKERKDPNVRIFFVLEVLLHILVQHRNHYGCIESEYYEETQCSVLEPWDFNDLLPLVREQNSVNADLALIPILALFLIPWLPFLRGLSFPSLIVVLRPYILYVQFLTRSRILLVILFIHVFIVGFFVFDL